LFVVEVVMSADANVPVTPFDEVQFDAFYEYALLCHITYRFTPTVLGPVTGSTSGSINGQPFAFDFSGTGVGLRFLGFLSPTNDAANAGRMLTGKVALGDINGNRVPGSYAQTSSPGVQYE
jgi:hypothetical protein